MAPLPSAVFDMKVLYRPGICNKNADTMSWKPNDSTNQVVAVREITCLSDIEVLQHKQI